MGKPFVTKLAGLLLENRDDDLRKLCKKMNWRVKQRVIEKLFKRADNLPLIDRLYKEIKFRKRNRLIKILIKKKERLGVLEWYIDKLVSTCKPCSDDDENESELTHLSRKLFKPMRYALSKHISAFRIIATKIQIHKDPMLLFRFFDGCQITSSATHELTKLDINGYFGYSKSDAGRVGIICKLDYLKQLKHDIQRIAYILDNLKFKHTSFDPDRFDECCVCLEKPIDAVINKCGHFTCGKCFFTMMDRTMFKVICPVCRSKANGVYELEYAYYPLSLKDGMADVYRHGRTVITVESNGHAIMYT